MFFIRYLAALCYDVMILSVLFFALTVVILLLNHGQAIPPATYWYQAALLFLALAYYYTSLQFGGQTLGMKAWRFKLSAINQEFLSKQQIITRIIYWLPALLIASLCFRSHYTLLNQWTKTDFKII